MHMHLRTSILRFSCSALCTIVVAGVASAPAVAQGTNLVVNGGFENVTNGYADSWTREVGTCNPFIAYEEIEQSAAHSGKYGAEFGANSCQGGLEQTLATTMEKDYTVSFFARAMSNAQPNSLQFFFGGNSIFHESLTNTGFMQFTTTAMASSNSTLFTVEGGNVQGLGYINLDDVSVTQAVTTTPEPSSMALLGTGLLGLVPMVRRKRG